MSVILTASKKSTHPKPRSAKPKHKKKKEFNPTPPLSNPKTQVWHWLLEGVPTTVMFTKDSNEVWCNGAVLDTIDGFAEDDMCGGNIDFCIMMEDAEMQHKARVTRHSVPGRHHDELVHMLFVDGYMITEHTGQPPQEAYTNISQSEAMGVAPSTVGGAQSTSPPSYDDLYGGGARSNGFS